MSAPLHLAVALDGAGWHPAAWREPEARPAELFQAGYWLDLVHEAEAGLLDFVTFEDAFGLQSSSADGPDDRTDRVRGRLDTVLVAAAVAPRTSRIGLVPTIVATHTEPFHISKAIASLDYASHGRAGYRVRIASSQADARLVGRRELPAFDPELFVEAADHIEVVRRLWDSWEDDAEIRDVATGRFVDRDKLHYIDFEGHWFDVKGPSITPRPPQGQPLVVVLAHATPAYELGVSSADLVIVTPHDADDARRIAAEVPGPLLFGDLEVYLDDTKQAAVDRKARLDDLAGERRTDTEIFTGTPAGLARTLLDWQAAGLTGVRLRPGALPHDLTAITRALVPALQAEGAFRREYDDGTLRARLGLPRPANRYATAGGAR